MLTDETVHVVRIMTVNLTFTYDLISVFGLCVFFIHSFSSSSI